jgi:succinoglycan biosynthesis protein ExoV
LKLHYYTGKQPNFGDELNLLLWPRLIPDVLAQAPDMLFLGIGTILSHDTPAKLGKIVLGSGAGYRRPPTLDSTWDILGVRGPLTARTLGLPQRMAITDPAVLLNQLYTAPVTIRHRIAFMPHHDSQRLADWRCICQQLGIHYIDPCSLATADIIDDIRRSGLLITEAMHGAIVADAFRVPWIPIVCYSHILRFKWEDWCLSLGMQYQPERLPAISNIPLNVSPLKRLRHWLKYPAVKLKLLPERWSKLLPRPSSPEELERATQQLALIAETQRGVRLSSDPVLQQARERFQDAIQLLRRYYA